HRRAVPPRCDHLTDRRWSLQAPSAQPTLGAQRQGALTTGRSQPGQIVEAGRADAVGGTGGTAEAQQAAIDLVNIYPLVNQFLHFRLTVSGRRLSCVELFRPLLPRIFR